jgi:ligand-binding sensor domain-containing protein
VPAVAADGAGGCWFAASDGTVGHIDAAGGVWTARLPGADPPPVRALTEDGPNRVWVGTDAGVYRLRRPGP